MYQYFCNETSKIIIWKLIIWKLLKLGYHFPKKLFLFPSMKTHFMSKALFVLEKFTFLFWFFGYVKKRLDQKAMVNFKIYDNTHRTTNNSMHILSNSSRSKGNQTIKFAPLIEYKMGNSFLKMITQNVVEKLVSVAFIENENWAYLWINSLKCFNAHFYYVQVEVYENILNFRCWPLAFTFYNAFLKTKRGLELAFHLHNFRRKIFFTLNYLLTD